ncbi:MAG TPA: hypothetical protein VHZ51_06050 [Ktedonobacteraceae bacterium]|nr:hypothetical protein [Ktedonobacteraceae bacterium]
MMKYKKCFSWLSSAMLIMLALFVSACSNTGTTSTSQGTTTTQTSAATGHNQQALSASTTPKMGSQATILPMLPLTQIRMTDATHGWALDKNNVLKTSDGGKTWVALTPNGATISATSHADFLNASDAWFTAPNTQSKTTIAVFRTTNGGASWNESTIYESAPDEASLTFFSSKTGWLEVSPSGPGAGSEGIDIFRTDDGGATWNKISTSGQGQNALPTGGIKSGLSFINAATGWATGEDASGKPWLYMTHDGGKTWYQKSISGLSSSNSAGYQTMPPVLLGRYGFLPMTVSTSTTPRTVLARTTDGGADWTVSGQQMAPFQSSNVYVVNAQTAWATDQNTGDVYQTNNGGQSWQKVASSTGIYGPLSFINTSTGFGLGRPDQTVLKRTNDGGKTWQTIAYQIHG